MFCKSGRELGQLERGLDEMYNLRKKFSVWAPGGDLPDGTGRYSLKSLLRVARAIPFSPC